MQVHSVTVGCTCRCVFCKAIYDVANLKNLAMTVIAKIHKTKISVYINLSTVYLIVLIAHLELSK